MNSVIVIRLLLVRSKDPINSDFVCFIFVFLILADTIYSHEKCAFDNTFFTILS